MSTDVEKLVVQLSADLKQYQREMLRAQGITNQRARAIEKRFMDMDKRLSSIGQSAARNLIAPLSGVAAALTTKEVLAYADAWTKAKNSLAVAGVTGDAQSKVLESLYESAQRNGAPVGALADLFGKAAQASDNLGASQADLVKFSDGVGIALRVAGTSAGEASGALTQLGQLLGSARVQAEEFNSVNEGARPILIAVANGLDAAGGSVNKLKQLVNEGKVTGQQFFQAFLKGLPAIQSMAANSTQTIEQGVTKINNAFTRYIGQSDESLGATQRLTQALNAIADNFDQTADVVLKVAAIIAGALVGRAIGGMITKLGLAIPLVLRFVAALRAAATVGQVATAFGGLGAAAGPLGAVIGGTVVAALALFSSSSAEASAGAKTYAQALAEVERRAEEAAPAISGAAKAIDEQTRNSISAGLSEAAEKMGEARDKAISLFSAIIDNAPRRLINEEQLASLKSLRDGLNDGSKTADQVKQALYALANSNPNFQRLADQMAPLLDTLTKAIAAQNLLQNKLGAANGLNDSQAAAYKQYAQSRAQGEEMLRLGKAYAKEAERQNSLTKDQLELEQEIASVKKDLGTDKFLPANEIKALAQRNLDAKKRRDDEGKKPKAVKATADSRFDQDIQSVRDRTAALIDEQKTISQGYKVQEQRRMALDLEQNALADLREEARKKGRTDLDNIKLSQDQIDKINDVSAAYAEQADQLRKLQESQERADRASEEFYDSFKSNAIDAISGATKLKDALVNIAKKLGDLALNSVFDQLFAPKTSSSDGGMFGSFFSGIGKWLGFSTGGAVKAATGGRIAGPGTGKSDSIPAMLSNGEYVVNAQATQKNRALLDAINNGHVARLAAGGAVNAPRIPSLRGMASSGANVSINFAPVIDARGADAEGIAAVRRDLAKMKAEFPGIAIGAYKDARRRRVI